jgi:hypothetical protein
MAWSATFSPDERSNQQSGRKSAMTKSVWLAGLILIFVSGVLAQTAPTMQTGRERPARDPSTPQVPQAQHDPLPITLSPQAEGKWEKVYTELMSKDTWNARGHANVGFSPAIMSIRDKPFTATRVYTNERRASDSDAGDSVTGECTIARDEKGRVHYEMPLSGIQRGKLVITGFDIQIYDPVAHTLTRYIANSSHEPLEAVAHIRKLRLMSEPAKPASTAAKEEPAPVDDTNTETKEPGASPAKTEPQLPQAETVPPTPAAKAPTPPPPVKFVPTKDNLPVQSVDGVSVVVHRVILKYGPKQQYFQIEENWLSPEYGIDMRRTVLRETIGTETIETKNILDQSPDPALFKVPPDYRIEVEE